MTDKNLVVQHNKIIEARYRLSIGEQRLIKLLVSMIERDDEDFKKYQIRVVDLASLLDIKRKDFYAAVKLATKKLIGNVLTFDIDGETFQASWLASAHYHKGNGVVDLQFAPLLKPFLLQLKQHFTSYELGNVIHLSHTHSIRVYELLKQYEKIGKRRFTIEQLKEVLMLDDGQYKLYKDFKKYVLITAQEELEEKTDIAFEMIEERKWKTCVAIEFIIKSKERKQNLLQSDYPPILKTEENSKGRQSNPTVEQLMKLGVTLKIAEEIVKEYKEDKILAAISYTQNQEKEGKVKNLAGFVVEAIKNEYRDNYAEERKKQEVTLQEAKDREENSKRWEAVKEAYKKSKDATFEKWYPTLNPDDVAGYRETYVAALSPYISKNETVTERIFLSHFKNDVMKFPSLREWMGKQKNITMAEFEEELARYEFEKQKAKSLVQTAA